MIDLSALSLYSISSELILSIGALILLMLGLIKSNIGKLFIYAGIFILLIAIYSLNFSDSNKIKFFNDTISSNQFISLTQALIMTGSALSLLIAASYSNVKAIFLASEYTIILLFSTVGMLLMTSANDYMILYLGLELQSLCLYLLACYDRDNLNSSEAGIKYFVLGALASGILLYGISLIYGFSGTINFTQFSEFYSTYPSDQTIPIGLLIGIVMVIIGFSFKLAAAPFHMWAPDVYQGAPLPVTAFFAIAPKIAAVTILAKLLMVHFNIWVDSWIQITSFLAIASMLVGALGALVQKDIKRLLAYSAIGHVGYMLIAISTQTTLGLEALVVYIATYSILSAGVFALITLLQSKEQEQYKLTSLSGLAKTHPVIAACISMLMLSMAGIPPFAGFIAKFYVFIAAIQAELYYLSIIGLLINVISAYYYLRIIKIMYFDDISDYTCKVTYYWETTLIAFAVIIVNLLLFVLPSEFNETVRAYIINLMGYK